MRGSRVPQDGVLELRIQRANPIKRVCDQAEGRRRRRLGARLIRHRPRTERAGRSRADEHIYGACAAQPAAQLLGVQRRWSDLLLLLMSRGRAYL